MLIFRGFFHKTSNNMENINRKHFRCCRKLQLWRVFHIVLGKDRMRLLPIQTSKSVKRRSIFDSRYLLLSGVKSVRNWCYCLLCFHWPGNQQMHSPFKTAELHSSANWMQWTTCTGHSWQLAIPAGALHRQGCRLWDRCLAGNPCLVLLKILPSEIEDGLFCPLH